MIMPGKQVLYQGVVWDVEELITRAAESGQLHDAAKICRQYENEEGISCVSTKIVLLHNLKELDEG